MRSSANTCIFAFSVFPYDRPVEIMWTAAFERGVDARKNARWTHVRVLIETLAYLQAKTPERDMVGYIRISGGTEKNSVLVAKCIETIVRHHHAMCTIVIAAPFEVLKLKVERVRACCKGLKQFLPGWDDLLADSVSGNRRDAVTLHIIVPGN